jgi:hypothetical protein
LLPKKTTEALRRFAETPIARRVCAVESAFIREIAGHWATDPRYAEKLQALLNEVKGILSAGEAVAT